MVERAGTHGHNAGPICEEVVLLRPNYAARSADADISYCLLQMRNRQVRRLSKFRVNKHLSDNGTHLWGEAIVLHEVGAYKDTRPAEARFAVYRHRP